MSPKVGVSLEMPVAKKEAEDIWQKFCDDPSVSVKETIRDGIRDIQRRTLLAAAAEFGHRPSSIPMSQGCAVLCPKCVLERLARELGGER